MVVLAGTVEAPEAGRRRPRRIASSVLVGASGFALGYLGWLLVHVGGSLVAPSLVVFGVGCALAVLCLIVSRSVPVVVALGVVTVLATVWTFQFALPASMAWDAGATAQARGALVQLSSSPDSRYGVPLHPCSMRVTGHIGPVTAPYRQCAVATPEGHFVLFTSGSQTSRGVAFTDIGGRTFPDACARHLVGQWWMFTASTGGLGGCPIGYGFNGGG